MSRQNQWEKKANTLISKRERKNQRKKKKEEANTLVSKRERKNQRKKKKKKKKEANTLVSNRERKKKKKNEANMWEMGDLEVNFKVRGIFEPHFMNFSLLIFFQFGKKTFR